MWQGLQSGQAIHWATIHGRDGESPEDCLAATICARMAARRAEVPPSPRVTVAVVPFTHVLVYVPSAPVRADSSVARPYAPYAARYFARPRGVLAADITSPAFRTAVTGSRLVCRGCTVRV